MSPCRASSRAIFRHIKRRFDEARDVVTGLELCDDELLAAKYFLELADCAAPAWRFRSERRASGKVDRRAGMLGGPLFTSKAFPWPFRNGIFATAIVQIRLEEFSELCGLPLGSGLLQVWAHASGIPDVEVRLITPPAVSAETSEPPFLLDGFNYDSAMEDSDRVRPRWVSEGCIQITGYEGPFFSYPKYQLGNPKQETEEALRELGMEKSAAKLRRLSRFDRFCQDNFESYAFGTFERDTYGPDERPPPLFCLGSGLPFWFSYMGGLQVFFTIDENTGDASFDAEWAIMT